VACPTYCTGIAIAEIHAGIRPGEEPQTEAFFEARGEVGLDGRVGRRAGAYLARYAKSHAVEIADALVAAAAATSGQQLWTLNREQYPMTTSRSSKRRDRWSKQGTFNPSLDSDRRP
jgi:predicted nucleic acid-binding protein